MNAAIHVAGWTLLHFAWQGAVVGLAAAIALRLLRDAAPQSRYVVGCIALAAMLALPGVTAWRLSATADVVGSAPPLQRSLFLRVAPAPREPHDRLIIGVRRYTAAPPASSGGTDAAVSAVVLRAVVGVWLGGVCLLLARLAGGWWRVHRLQRLARALPASRWQAACDRLSGQLGLKQLVLVVDAALVDSPAVIGWLQPVVLLPVAAVAGLTPEQVQAILAHELAHVRRHDAVANFAQTVAETLLFYHPAVWWVSSQIRTEREHCCDDVALAVSGDPYVYASALAELESRRAAPPALALAATGGPLLRRVTRVLAPPAAHARRGGLALTLVLALVFIVGTGALQLLVARQPAPQSGVPRGPVSAWRMIFDHPSGQMTIRGFSARDLVRYAYQLPTSRVVGGPSWLDSDSFDLATTIDHVPAADETPAIVRQLLEDRFALRVHESTVKVPAFALQLARPDGSLGPNLQSATAECFDQKAWVAAGAPPRGPLPLGQMTPFCGVWDGGVAGESVRSITMDDFAVSLRNRFAPSISRDVINRTGLEGPFDVSVEYFKPAAVAMEVTPSLRAALRLAGFVSVSDVLESQLGLKLVPVQAEAPTVVIDEIQRPLPDLAQP